MKDDKDKWIENVFDSMKGSKRAKPSHELFAKIEHQINAPEAKTISMRQWSYTVAAAVLVLVLNVFALRQITQSNELNAGEMIVSDASSQSLISNYNIYE